MRAAGGQIRIVADDLDDVRRPPLAFSQLGLQRRHRRRRGLIHLPRVGDVARCAKALGDGSLPAIRLHDLRHTHATLLLTAREPVHVVSQRLGHASAVVTMTVYAHVLPGSQREAAGTFARLIGEAAGS